MPSTMLMTFQDYARTIGRVEFDIPYLTVENFDPVLIACGALESAVIAVQNEDTLQADSFRTGLVYGRAPGALKSSSVKMRWVVELRDVVTGRSFKREIPIAKLALLSGRSDYLDLSAGAGLALKSAIEAVAVSNVENAVTVVSVRFTGER